jgi:hypothetical protein
MKKIRRIKQEKSVAVFNFDDLPTAAKARLQNPLAGVRLRVDDLHPAQRSMARSKQLCAVLKDGITTILSPTGDIVEAVRAVRKERGL